MISYCIFLGSSTCSVITINADNYEIQGSNLGDSGYLILRDGKIVTRSPIQQYRFNAPYQITLGPDGKVKDEVPKATSDIIQGEEGDLIIIATDGLWDNLFESEIMEIAAFEEERIWRMENNSNGTRGKSLIDPSNESSSLYIAETLVKEAKKASISTNRDSPFSIEARKHGITHLGGKEDDITVIVAKLLK